MKVFLLQYNRANVREQDVVEVAKDLESTGVGAFILAPTDEVNAPSYKLIEVPERI